MRNCRAQAGFEGYVTSDSDSVRSAYECNDHCYPQPNPNAAKATALALKDGQCDINSGDTYNNNLLQAVKDKVEGLTMKDVDRALFNSLKQRFDLGLFDPKAAYDWPNADSIGTDASLALTLQSAQESLVLLRNDRYSQHTENTNSMLLPLPAGKTIAVLGPHATAQKVMAVAGRNNGAVTFCPSGGLDCITSPYAAIAALNKGGHTTTAPGCDLFLPPKSSADMDAALKLAKEADYIVLGEWAPSVASLYSVLDPYIVSLALTRC
jgi:beta-glucosidase-like glycosyl hydrolase